MLYNHLPVFQASYQLTLEIYQISHNFPREYRYTLGQKLKNQSSLLLDNIVKTNLEKDKTKILSETITSLEQMRIHLRLASDLKILGLKNFELLAKKLENISQQLISWHTWAKEHNAKNK